MYFLKDYYDEHVKNTLYLLNISENTQLPYMEDYLIIEKMMNLIPPGKKDVILWSEDCYYYKNIEHVNMKLLYGKVRSKLSLIVPALYLLMNSNMYDKIVIITDGNIDDNVEDVQNVLNGIYEKYKAKPDKDDIGDEEDDFQNELNRIYENFNNNLKIDILHVFNNNSICEEYLENENNVLFKAIYNLNLWRFVHKYIMYNPMNDNGVIDIYEMDIDEHYIRYGKKYFNAYYTCLFEEYIINKLKNIMKSMNYYLLEKEFIKIANTMVYIKTYDIEMYTQFRNNLCDFLNGCKQKKCIEAIKNKMVSIKRREYRPLPLPSETLGKCDENSKNLKLIDGIGNLKLIDDIDLTAYSDAIPQNGVVYMKNIPRKSLVFEKTVDINRVIITEFPYLKHINFEKSCIAGGFCTSVLLDIRPINDIDVWLYCDDDEYPTRLYNLIHSIHDAYLKYKPDTSVKYIMKKNTNVLDIIYDDIKFQIILVKYTNIVDILDSFDLDSCKVVYKNNSMYMNEDSIISFRYMVNVYNPTLNICNKKRILKYMDRGFKFLIPEKYKLDGTIHNGVYYVKDNTIPVFDDIVKKCKSNQSQLYTSADNNKPLYGENMTRNKHMKKENNKPHCREDLMGILSLITDTPNKPLYGENKKSDNACNSRKTNKLLYGENTTINKALYGENENNDMPLYGDYYIDHLMSMNLCMISSSIKSFKLHDNKIYFKKEEIKRITHEVLKKVFMEYNK